MPGAAETLIAGRPDVIFHLAAIVSGEAELDFDKGYRINLDGTRMLMDAIRLARRRLQARLVFTSSIAVFGAPYPGKDRRRVLPYPADELRHPEVDLRTPDRRLYRARACSTASASACRRSASVPGKPNKAASGFFSNILREPLGGKEAVLPVSEDVRHWHASPKSAVGFLLHAGTMDLAAVGARRNLSMPGLSATVGEQIAALKRVAGKKRGGADQARA